MEVPHNYLNKELKPVTVYLEDLYWIEEYIGAIDQSVELTYVDSENEPRYIKGVENLGKDYSIIGLTKLDNLEINSYEYHVWFHNNNTTIKFIKVTMLTKKIFEDICNRLERKQRLSRKFKQQIFLYHKHIKKGNFLTQDKVPLWLAILIGLLPSLLAIYALIR